jgi:polysaccharide chain length determinant protein (PEP-CTERM system associated)
VVPGKKYAPEDYLAIAWAKRWIIVVPFVLATAGAIGYAMTQPDRYRAETAIIITPQQVPANFVQSTITMLLTDRLQTIRAQVTSRTRLERIIEEFNLYPDERANGMTEDVIEQMRRDISVEIQRGPRRADTGAFSVGFEAENPRTALLVTERLSSLFIRENLEDRAVLADATSQFLEAQLEEARRRLMDHEKKLQDYRQRNAGSLPSQVASNLQGIQTTQMQLQSLRAETSTDRDRRLFLDRAIADAEATPAAMVSAAPATSAEPPPPPAATRLESARAALRNMELRLKPDHPDIQRTKRIIRDLEKEAEAEALARPVGGDGGSIDPGMSPAERNRQSRIAAMRAEIDLIDRRLAARQAEEERLRNNLSAYQARVDAAPARETELIELTRDYDILKHSYDELLRKNEDAKLSVTMERREIGEQFRIVDPARLPDRPVSPDRPRIIGLGAAMGLGIGLVLVALIEYRDSTLKTEPDVLVSLALPVLALIPAMVTKVEERARRRRRRMVALGSAAVMMLVVVGAAAWKLELFERWVG